MQTKNVSSLQGCQMTNDVVPTIPRVFCRSLAARIISVLPERVCNLIWLLTSVCVTVWLSLSHAAGRSVPTNKNVNNSRQPKMSLIAYWPKQIGGLSQIHLI